ncbi:MAG: prolyl oligopeptidase family serine peptidase, partial [Myxococcales bacterium]|nr:prolyl oligopeptidase family serine peptidase [Myxococcales bacterium]
MPTIRSVLLPALLSVAFVVACRPSASETPADRAPSAEGDAGAPAAAPSPYSYPATRRADTAEELHGTRVADPYRWLEDLDAPETRAWVEAENAVTFGYLETIAARAPIRARLTELWNYERFGLPMREGKHYFYSRNDGLQNQNVIYVTPSLDAEAKVFLDPNTLSEDGTVALGSFTPGPKGKLVAYGIKRAGSDWEEFKVRDIKTGKDLPDHIQWSKFSEISWTKDGKGFFYARFAAPKEGETFEGANYNHMIYYHALGAPQADDVKIYERPDQPRWGFGSSVTEDGRYLVSRVWEGTSKKNGVFVLDLKAGPTKGQFVELLNQFDAEYSFVGNQGSKLLFRTDKDAPRGRVIEIDLKRPDPADWKTIIPQAPETLHGASYVGGKLFARYLKDVRSQVKVFSLKGALEREVEFPGIGTVYGFGGKQDAKETFYTFTSFTEPGTVYRYDIKSGESSVFKSPALKFNPDDYETRQVFYKSKDGTTIPMFITAKKGLELNGQNPTYLYAYGGFNISLTPGFSVPNLAWMEMGGVYAVANLRGGGEFGEEWHRGGNL